MRPSRRAVLASAPLALAAALPARAEWPGRPIRLVVSFVGGNSSDTAGYTLLWSGNRLSSTYVLQRNPGFDPPQDFAPVARVVTNACVPASRRWQSVADPVAAARAAPQGRTCGSGGIGTAAPLAAAALRRFLAEDHAAMARLIRLAGAAAE